MDVVSGLAVDAAGRACIAGYTQSFSFPTTEDAWQRTSGNPPDAFVARLDDAGKTITYSTLLGGAGNDAATGLALDAAGNAYIAGYTSSSNFPTTSGVLQRKLAGPSNAFVAKVDFLAAKPVTTPTITKVGNYVTQKEIVAPGSIAVVVGQRLAKDTVVFADPLGQAPGNLPRTINGTSAATPLYPYPLFSVSPDQLVVQVPFGAQGYQDLAVTMDNETSKRFQFGVGSAALGIFGVYKTDMTRITTDSPVKPGDEMVAWVTGAGLTNPNIATGAPAPADQQVNVRDQPYVTIAQQGSTARCDITSYTLVPGMVGVAELRVRIPTWVSSESGDYEFVVNPGTPTESNRIAVYLLMIPPP